MAVILRFNPRLYLLRATVSTVLRWKVAVKSVPMLPSLKKILLESRDCLNELNSFLKTIQCLLTARCSRMFVSICYDHPEKISIFFCIISFRIKSKKKCLSFFTQILFRNVAIMLLFIFSLT